MTDDGERGSTAGYGGGRIGRYASRALFLAFILAYLASCSDDKSSNPWGPWDGGRNPDPDGGIPPDQPDGGSAPNADGGPDGDGGEPYTNEISPGIYRFANADCNIIDVDVVPEWVESSDTYVDRLIAQCGNLRAGENFFKYFKISDLTDPTDETLHPDMRDAVAKTVEDWQASFYDVTPIQIEDGEALAYGGIYMVPFSGSGGAATCLSGLSFVTPGGLKVSTADPFTFVGSDPDNPFTMQPCSIKSALIAYDEAGPEIWMPAAVTSPDGEIGILKPCDLAPAAPYELVGPSCKAYPIFLSGIRPTAIARINNFYDPEDTENGYAAVLNSRGYSGAAYTPEFGIANASINIVKLEHLPVAESPIVATIDLGVPEAVPLKELAVTSDKKYAVVAAEGKIIVANLEHPESPLGIFAAPAIKANQIRGIAVHGDEAYVSMSDSVYVFDISNPAAPTSVRTILVGSGIGDIDVDGNGIIYARMPDPANLSGSKIYTINPSQVP